MMVYKLCTRTKKYYYVNIYFPIKNIVVTFFVLDCIIKNETFFKLKISSFLFFLSILFYYFYLYFSFLSYFIIFS